MRGLGLSVLRVQHDDHDEDVGEEMGHASIKEILGISLAAPKAHPMQKRTPLLKKPSKINSSDPSPDPERVITVAPKLQIRNPQLRLSSWEVLHFCPGSGLFWVEGFGSRCRVSGCWGDKVPSMARPYD